MPTYWVVYWHNSSGVWQLIYQGWDSGQAQANAAEYYTQGDNVFAWIWDPSTRKWTARTQW